MKIIQELKSADDYSYPMFRVIQRSFQDGSEDYIVEEQTLSTIKKHDKSHKSYTEAVDYVGALLDSRKNCLNSKIVCYITGD